MDNSFNASRSSFWRLQFSIKSKRMLSKAFRSPSKRKRSLRAGAAVKYVITGLVTTPSVILTPRQEWDPVQLPQAQSQYNN